MDKKKQLITDIIQTLVAGGAYITGDLFFMLAFRSESELVQIAQELNIKV